MESFGVHVVVLDTDPERTGNRVNVYGSTTGINFVENHDNLMWEFAVFNSGNAFE